MSNTKKFNQILGVARISMGLIFLWAFFDKLLGLGLTTAAEKAWINGGSPTFGFLKFASKGPLDQVCQAIAGNPFVDWLFMTGLLFIGIALVLGIATRLAGYSGALLMFLMWLAVLPPEHHPFLDEHIIYILLLKLFVYGDAGQYFGLSKKWNKLSLVKKFSWLK